MKVMGHFIPLLAHPEAAGSSGSPQWMLSLLKQGKYFSHGLGYDFNGEKTHYVFTAQPHVVTDML